MKKNILIAVLSVLSVISITSLSSMSSRASYWMGRCIAAEEIINRVEEDQEDYVLDVLCESDVWYEWYDTYCPGM